MSTIVTRAGKGSALTHNEVDANFVNLNTDKLQSGDTAAALTITSATINGGTITGTALNGTLGATTPSTVAATTISASGNLGIGTSSPSTYGKLVVDTVGGNAVVFGDLATPANETTLYLRSTLATIATAAAGALRFTTGSGGTERMRIDSSGNVGIGNASPTYTLDVTKSTGSTVIRALSSTAGYSSSVITSGNGIGYFGTSNAYPMGILVNNAEIARFDTSGNLGLGVTPSAWSVGKAIEVGVVGNAIWGVNANSVYLSQNAYYNVNWKYANTTTATRYSQVSGVHSWETAPSGTAGNAITFTQAMTLDASGRLLVGTTTSNAAFGGNLQVEGTSNAFASLVRYSSSASGAPGLYLARSKSATLGTNTIVASGDVLGTVLFSGANGTGYSDAAYIQSSVDGTPGASADMPGRLTFATSGDGSATPTERMRINSSGNVGIGTASPDRPLTINATGTNGTQFHIISGSAAGFQLESSAGKIYEIQSNASSNLIVYDRTAAATRLTIDSSGNVGLGVTPSAWVSSWKAIDWGTNTAVISGGGAGNAGTYVINNAYYDTTLGLTYKSTFQAAYYQQVAGKHNWYTAPSGTAGNAITFTQAMTLDASGNLLVGTTSSGYLCRVQAVTTGNADVYLAKVDNISGAPYVAWSATTSGNPYFALFLTETSYVPRGSITYNRAAGLTAYNTTSDYRLKENIVDLPDALESVLMLKPRQFSWKETGNVTTGFIAHELAEVCPHAVSGEKDANREEEYEISPAIPAVLDEEGNEVTPAVEAVMGTRTVPVYQGIDTSFLVATLTAAIQEQQAMIEELKAKVAALEAA